MRKKKLRSVGFYCMLAIIFLVTSCSNPSRSISRLDGSQLTFSEVDSIVRMAMSEAEVPGLQLAIFNLKEVAYMKSYGFKDSLKSVPMDNHTVIQSASFSKSIFATLVMRLVEEGLFDLDKPVYKYFDFPIYELSNSRFDYLDLKEDERYKKVTGRMLLTHTAGFRNYRRDKLELYFEPGSQYQYSGEGIILLQTIIEEALGRNLQELSEEYLFKPLEMNRSSFVWKEEFRTNTTYGFNREGIEYNERLDSVAMAAYSCVTTVSDFSKLVSALLNGRLLTNEMNVAMLSSQHVIRTKNQFGSDALVLVESNTKEGVKLSYGLGWGILDTPVGQAFFKEGKNPGYQNMSILFKNGTGLILMTNSDLGEQTFQYLNEQLIGNTYFPWKWESIYPFYVYRAFDELFEAIGSGKGADFIKEKYDELNSEYNSNEYSHLIFTALGNDLMRGDKIEDAIEIFQLNVQLNPDVAEAYCNLGDAFLKNDQKQQAILNYQNCLDLDPSNTNASEKIEEVRNTD